ncbi:MAG TPA: dihydrolipoamide acetyltransferase family protein [Dermatophilaceae bacterium]|nr:dihydrolipoamide acetyltransferase family protein [Dermatophilaceae bacterium]HOR16852.1 dihydrolipoamide acetyltransferase family protein [Dermatophilaceae bacterium]HOV01957.1 dihydrolipoamide acetyltransferase family protein [Dermatophilaceae bacterium]HPK90784.1 dihydrolipoamide acetyltransferase family protein [Dermatophilaceae bacterium]HQG11773.1 dihydrolipoamide acetyltransferase family protein [Dermatophilaceae bacterium]
MSVREFLLPDPGEGLTEAEIVTWRVAVGDVVKVNDIVVEIETAKSLVELPIPWAGTVAALLAPEGATVEVGSAIIAIDDPLYAGPPPSAAGPSAASSSLTAMAGNLVGGADSSTPSTSLGAMAAKLDGGGAGAGPATGGTSGGTTGGTSGGADEAVAEGLIGGTTSTGRTAVLVGYGIKQTEAVRRPRRKDELARTVARPPDKEGGHIEQPPSAHMGGLVAAHAPEVRRDTRMLTELAPVVAPLAPAPGAPVLAKPPVRKYAKDLGVDLAQVPTPTGIVTRADIDAYIHGGAPDETVTAAAYASGMPSRADARGETRVPIKGVRKMTAAAMVGSAFTAPHVTEWIMVDVTRTMELVDRLKADKEFKDVKVTPLLVLAKAMCLAVRRHPEINAAWDDAAQEIVVKHYVNLGIAAATPRGLIVPNIKDADLMTMHELAQALGELTATAREGRTQPAQMSGGTITITNVGVFGVDSGTPIINPGESAIMAFGAIRKQPWVITNAAGEDEIAVRQVTNLALSFDHRLVDGELGSRYLATVAAILEDPARGLVWG